MLRQTEARILQGGGDVTAALKPPVFSRWQPAMLITRKLIA
jgi:hypothetical protein